MNNKYSLFMFNSYHLMTNFILLYPQLYSLMPLNSKFILFFCHLERCQTLSIRGLGETLEEEGFLFPVFSSCFYAVAAFRWLPCQLAAFLQFHVQDPVVHTVQRISLASQWAACYSSLPLSTRSFTFCTFSYSQSTTI